MIIHEKNNPNFRLKEIDINDIEDLRIWKNHNKQYFFLKTDISPEQQENWFKNIYSADQNNHMFMVQEKTEEGFLNIGCMGYRLKENVIDVYNIMRGRPFKSANSMATAFNMMNNYIKNTQKEDITCVVLLDNPARSWYEKNAFEPQNQEEGYIHYTLNKAKLPAMNLSVHS